MIKKVVRITPVADSTIEEYTELGLYGKYLPRGAEWKEPIKNSCNRPYKTLTIDMLGGCYLCDCDGYLPISVGDIESFDSIESIFESPKAKMLQAMVDNKTYEHCSITHCGILQHNINEHEYHINIGADESCNLSCPTCRNGIINHVSGDLFEKRKKRVAHIKYLLDNFQKKARIRLSANGDPLASQLTRPLLTEWKRSLTKTVELQTNGLLMEKLLSDSEVIDNLFRVSVSVDAGTKEVYEIVRRPAKFEDLLENLDWLKSIRKSETSPHANLNFVLSALNAHDIINFAKLCERYGFRGIISKVENWFTFGDRHKEMAVLDDPSHPMYDSTIQNLKHVKDNYPMIIIENPIPSLL